MDTNRWHRLNQLLDELLDLSPEARTAYLDAHDVPDDLRHEVLKLLAHEHDADLRLGEHVDQLAHDLVPQALDEHDKHPEAVGPYRILRLLGRGGMGSVYLAQRNDGQFQQTVALKVVRRGLDTDDILQRFRYERQILAALQHPNIARLYDGGLTEDGRPYFAMEYIEGTPITDYAHTARLSTKARLRLFRTVCQAVQHAHQNLVVHRDLKPSNILVTAEGHVKLLDFGIAKLLTEETTMTAVHTRTGLRLLTPEYAAPEQVRGERITTAVDVYQLGVLLYELLTGVRPFRLAERAQREMERAILEEEPTRPSTAVTTGKGEGALVPTDPERLRRELSGELDHLVLMALRKEPVRRYPSAEALGSDVTNYLSGLPVAAQPDGVGYRVRKFVQRNRTAVATSGVIAVLITSLAVVSTVLAITSSRQQAEIAEERDRAEAVTEFMASFFEASDPRENLGADISVRQVLDEGRAKIEDDLAGQPELQGELYRILMEVYHNLSEDDEAYALAEQALTSFRKADDVFQEVKVLHEAAIIARTRGFAAQADSLLLRSDSLLLIFFPEDRFQRAANLRLRSNLAFDLGQTDNALQLIDESITLLRPLDTPDAQEVLDYALTDRGILLVRLDRFEEAALAYEEALSLSEQRLPPNHPSYLIGKYNLGDLYVRQGDYNRADTIYTEVLEGFRAVYQGDHVNITYALNGLGSLYHDLNRLEEAEAFYLEAIAMRTRLYGEGHPLIRNIRSNLALLYGQGMERYAEAVAIMRAVLVEEEVELGPDHPNVALRKHNIGAMYHLDKQYATSEQWLREALAGFRAAYPEEGIRHANTYLRLGRCIADQGRFAEAEPHYLRAYTLFDEVHGVNNPLTQRVIGFVATFYETWGKPEQQAQYEALLLEEVDAAA